MAALPVSSALPDLAEAGKVHPNAVDDVMARFPDEEMIDFIAIGSVRVFAHFCRRWLRAVIRAFCD